MASEIASQTLSGCPDVTDSELNTRVDIPSSPEFILSKVWFPLGVGFGDCYFRNITQELTWLTGILRHIERTLGEIQERGADLVGKEVTVCGFMEANARKRSHLFC